MNDFVCKICGNKSGNKFYSVREMQFGTRDGFIYYECSNCGCVQLVNPPSNLSKYYPPNNYFSFKVNKENFLKERLNIFRDRHAFGLKNLIGKILFSKFGEPTYIGWLKTAGVNINSKILDVGCGTGKLLYRMGNMGFKNLMGIDLFIEKDINYKNGVSIYKQSLFKIDEEFDLLMMHHSLEHFDDQHKVFEKLTRLLKGNGMLFIRIPICSSHAWRHYKENWFALEAPRHFFNHSKKSIQILAEGYGFKLEKIIYDSRSIQFWGSEQYKQNIHLMDERSYFVSPGNSIFTGDQMNYYELETKRLNEIGEGDQAGFFFTKIN